MSKKMYYLLFVLVVLISVDLQAQTETTNESTPNQTKQEQKDTPRTTTDSLNLETTEQAAPKTEDSVYNGDAKTLSAFSNIHIAGNYKVIIKQGESHTIEVECGKVFREVLYRVSGNTLRIGIQPLWENISRTTVYITTPNLVSLRVSGSNTVLSDGTLTVKCLDIKGSGASKINLKVDAECIDLDHSGAVSTYLTGKAERLDVRQTGASKLRASGLETQRVEILISGAGSAHVNAKDALEVRGSGICKVRYQGEPEFISKRLTGPCRIVKM